MVDADITSHTSGFAARLKGDLAEPALATLVGGYGAGSCGQKLQALLQRLFHLPTVVAVRERPSPNGSPAHRRRTQEGGKDEERSGDRRSAETSTSRTTGRACT